LGWEDIEGDDDRTWWGKSMNEHMR